MRYALRAVLAAAIIAALFITLPALLAASGERLKQVSPEFVCMINKKHFDREMAPVVVDGKTYYGCCDMCIKQLKEDSKSRFDVDPVSGKQVDKSAAAIGIDKQHNAYFFENAGNLKKFRLPGKPVKVGTN